MSPVEGSIVVTVLLESFCLVEMKTMKLICSLKSKQVTATSQLWNYR